MNQDDPTLLPGPRPILRSSALPAERPSSTETLPAGSTSTDSKPAGSSIAPLDARGLKAGEGLVRAQLEYARYLLLRLLHEGARGRTLNASTERATLDFLRETL
jgi:hypothetical protein